MATRYQILSFKDIDTDLTSTSANDDTVPSAKAAKAMGDLKLPLAGGELSGNLSFNASGGIIVPHMMQSDLTDQAIANVSNAQVITFDTDNHHLGITKTSTSRFTIVYPGSYLIVFSGIAIGVGGKIIEVWLKKNTAYVDNSNTRYQFKADSAPTVISMSFIELFAVGDYFEFWTWGNDVGNRWDYTAAGTNPTRPATPSIIMTCNYISKD
jgi:hypothetical protein